VRLRLGVIGHHFFRRSSLQSCPQPLSLGAQKACGDSCAPPLKKQQGLRRLLLVVALDVLTFLAGSFRGRVGAATPCWRLENSAAEPFGGTCSSRTGFDAVAMVVASDAPAALVVWASASASRSTHWHYIRRPRRRRERRAACPSAHRGRLALLEVLEDADAQCACHEPMRLGHQAASQRAELSIHGHGVYSRRSASRHLRMFGVRAIVGRHGGRQTVQASFKSYLITRACCARWPRLELRCSTA
jgi:hypothetical protein